MKMAREGRAVDCPKERCPKIQYSLCTVTFPMRIASLGYTMSGKPRDPMSSGKQWSLVLQDVATIAKTPPASCQRCDNSRERTLQTEPRQLGEPGRRGDSWSMIIWDTSPSLMTISVTPHDIASILLVWWPTIYLCSSGLQNGMVNCHLNLALHTRLPARIPSCSGGAFLWTSVQEIGGFRTNWFNMVQLPILIVDNSWL